MTPYILDTDPNDTKGVILVGVGIIKLCGIILVLETDQQGV